MRNYSSPCYTLTEAKEILELRDSEFLDQIRSGNLQAVLYTKPKKMLLFKRKEAAEWVGCGVCTYRGHIECHLDFVLTLLDSSSGFLGRSSLRLLEARGVANWSVEYPFKQNVPHKPLVDWLPLAYNDAIAQSYSLASSVTDWPIGRDQTIDQMNFPLYVCFATPFPEENRPIVKMLNEWFDKIVETGGLMSPVNDHLRYPLELDFFKESAKFVREDLRIPASEIARFNNNLKAKKREESIKDISLTIARKSSSKIENQLHELVRRILDTNPRISAKEAWAVIAMDCNKDKPLFDTDFILRRVDSVCIEWESRNKNTSSQSWGAFQSLLSNLKKELN